MGLPLMPTLLERRARLVTQMREAADAAARQTNVQAGSLGRPIRALSGGNQQKALIARWLMRGAALFVFMEPTRGVDIGARTEIYRQLTGLAAQGKAVLLVSTDVSEVLALADRIFVMYAGALAAVLDGREATEEQVVLAMQGELRNAG